MTMPVMQDQAPRQPEITNALRRLLKPADLDPLSSGGRIRIAPNYPFLLRHDPKAWDVASEGLDGDTWLPLLSRHDLRPGVNGVRTLNENEEPHLAYEDSVNNGMKAGNVYLDAQEPLPPEHLPEGAAPTGYLCEVKCRDIRTTAIGLHYIEAWSVPEETLPNEVQTFKFDHASYNRWRAHLILTGKIAPIQDRVIRAMQKRVGGHLGRAKVLNLPKELRQERIDEKRATVEKHANARRLAAPAIVEAIPASKRPSVVELTKQIGNIDDPATLRLLLHGESRATARKAIDSRIASLEATT